MTRLKCMVIQSKVKKCKKLGSWSNKKLCNGVAHSVVKYLRVLASFAMIVVMQSLISWAILMLSVMYSVVWYHTIPLQGMGAKANLVLLVWFSLTMLLMLKIVIVVMLIVLLVVASSWTLPIEQRLEGAMMLTKNRPQILLTWQNLNCLVLKVPNCVWGTKILCRPFKLPYAIWT